LAHGVPMVSLPVATDQFGVAARVERLGVGEYIPVRKVRAMNLRAAASRVLSDGDFAYRAEACARLIAELDGVRRAADIAESAFRTGRPVLAP
jgi:zeaxanthin glucosyltransferase